MNDEKLNDLRTILRDLSWLIGQQQEMILSHSATIGAVRMTLESDSVLSEKYTANLQYLKDDASKKQNQNRDLDKAAMSLVSELRHRMAQW